MVDYRYNSKRLLYHGIVYVKHYSKVSVSYWRCVDWKHGCIGRLAMRTINGYEMTNKANDKIIHIHDNQRKTE